MTDPANKTVLITGASGGFGESPQYGYEQRLVVPTHLVSDPAHVVAKLVARLTYYLLRFAPWLLPILDRRLYAQAVAAARRAG